MSSLQIMTCQEPFAPFPYGDSACLDASFWWLYLYLSALH